MEGRYAVFYGLAQLLAGVVAAAVAGLVHTAGRGEVEAASAGQVCVAEAFGAFFLCYAPGRPRINVDEINTRCITLYIAVLAYACAGVVLSERHTTRILLITLITKIGCSTSLVIHIIMYPVRSAMKRTYI